jgi:Fe-S oxidoreductase
MLSKLRKIFGANDSKPALNSAAPPPGMRQVTSDASRCVQCGICGYNCPVGIEPLHQLRRLRGEMPAGHAKMGAGHPYPF